MIQKANKTVKHQSKLTVKGLPSKCSTKKKKRTIRKYRTVRKTNDDDLQDYLMRCYFA